MSQPEAQVSGSELPVDEQCSSLSKVVRRKGGKFCLKGKASCFHFKKKQAIMWVTKTVMVKILNVSKVQQGKTTRLCREKVSSVVRDFR